MSDSPTADSSGKPSAATDPGANRRDFLKKAGGVPVALMAAGQVEADAAEQPFIAQAPVVLAVVDTGGGHVMFCGVPAGPVDCAIAIDHMTLAAVAEGIGSCWIGHFSQDACKSILNVPDEHTIIEMLPLGYPAAASEAAKKRKPLDEVVAHETFDQDG